jgi:hypothetical protein
MKKKKSVCVIPRVLSLSLSHTHTLFLSFALSLFLSFSLFLFLFLFLFLSLSLSLSKTKAPCAIHHFIKQVLSEEQEQREGRGFEITACSKEKKRGKEEREGREGMVE